MTGSTLQPFSPKINICLKICQLVKAGAFNSTTVRILPCTVSTHICLSKNLAAHFKVLQPYQVNYREQWVRTVEKLLRKKNNLWYATKLKLLYVTKRNSCGVEIIICFPKFMLLIKYRFINLKSYPSLSLFITLWS